MEKIKLTKGLFTLVDDEDYEWLNQWKWCAHGKPGKEYAVRTEVIDGKPKTIMMHRLLNQTPVRLVTDHIDRNTLNNCKINLRTATHSENAQNSGPKRNSSSGFKGVGRCSRTGGWQVFISIKGKTKPLGRFKKAEDGAKAYDEQAKKLHGEFARLNFPKTEV